MRLRTCRMIISPVPFPVQCNAANDGYTWQDPSTGITWRCQYNNTFQRWVWEPNSETYGTGASGVVYEGNVVTGPENVFSSSAINFMVANNNSGIELAG